jgi:hypothetical protein
MFFIIHKDEGRISWPTNSHFIFWDKKTSSQIWIFQQKKNPFNFLNANVNLINWVTNS